MVVACWVSIYWWRLCFTLFTPHTSESFVVGHFQNTSLRDKLDEMVLRITNLSKHQVLSVHVSYIYIIANFELQK